MLTAEQRAEFERAGIIKLEGAFSAADAERMRDVMWAELSRRHGMRRDDPATWTTHNPTGMTTSKTHHAFDPILGLALRGALDDLLGRWAEPKHHGQVLVTMPDAAEWQVPDRLWHTDIGFEQLPIGHIGLKHWAIVDTVEPGGGGTVQLAGSHRLLTRYAQQQSPDELEYKRIRDGFLASHPWLRALSRPDDDPNRNRRFMSADEDIDGLPARVVELTGEPGDVYLTHLQVLHAKAPNASRRPRMMRSRTFLPLPDSAGE
jgi:hypothetical protein